MRCSNILHVSITNAYIDNKGVERSQAPSILSDLFDLDVTSCHTHRSALSETRITRLLANGIARDGN